MVAANIRKSAPSRPPPIPRHRKGRAYLPRRQFPALGVVGGRQVDVDGLEQAAPGIADFMCIAGLYQDERPGLECDLVAVDDGDSSALDDQEPLIGASPGAFCYGLPSASNSSTLTNRHVPTMLIIGLFIHYTHRNAHLARQAWCIGRCGVKIHGQSHGCAIADPHDHVGELWVTRSFGGAGDCFHRGHAVVSRMRITHLSGLRACALTMTGYFDEEPNSIFV